MKPAIWTGSYVHKDHQRKGVATAICDALEQNAKAEKFTTHASITAKPFFEKRGIHGCQRAAGGAQGCVADEFCNEEGVVREMLYNAKNGTLKIGGSEMDYIRFGTGGKVLVMLPGLGDGLRSVKGTALPMAFAYRAFAKAFTVYAFSRKNGLLQG